jgi:hypothetical protein
MAHSVPLSRFTSRVGGGSAFFVRRIRTPHKNMITTTKTKRFGILFYSIATVLVLLGVALNLSGSVRVGTLLIVVSITMACSTAVRLGHLKRW